MNGFPRVLLKAKEEKEIAQGFPWVYENEIDAVKYVAHDGSGVKTVALSEVPAADGTLVEVYARSGTFLGTGVLNRASKIAVRLVGAVHADVIMEDVSA